MKNVEEYCPKDRQDWRAWLELNHATKDAVWLVFYKKRSADHNLSWSEAVDEALCFGWIDSTKRSIDSDRYEQYFAKRKAKSNWSRINKEKMKALTEQGLMREAGRRSIEVAKDNGSWNVIDDVEAVKVPQDLKEALEKRKGSMEYFDGLSRSSKKILLHWVASAKRNDTRRKRISEIADSASGKQKPKQFRRR